MLLKVCNDVEFIILKAVIFVLGIAALGSIVVRMLNGLT
jgi:hypothetical protein